MLDRRKFLSVLGLGATAALAAEAIPFNRVWSFSKQIVLARPCNVRFIRAFDMRENKMICRLDVLYGWNEVALPSTVEEGELISVPRESLVQNAVEELAAKHGANQLPSFDHLRPTTKHDSEVRGFWFYENLSNRTLDNDAFSDGSRPLIPSARQLGFGEVAGRVRAKTGSYFIKPISNA
jgi:hypothetical protein